jgi:hypothetical protein
MEGQAIPIYRHRDDKMLEASSANVIAIPQILSPYFETSLCCCKYPPKPPGDGLFRRRSSLAA